MNEFPFTKESFKLMSDNMPLPPDVLCDFVRLPATYRSRQTRNQNGKGVCEG